MGLSSKKTKVTSTPHDPAAIKAGTNALTGTYNTNAPKVQAASDRFLDASGGLLDRAIEGNPAVNAAQGYITDTLGGDGTNPHLDAWIGQAQNDATNQMGARLNKLGLGPAGSTYQGTVGREVGRVGLGMKYDDWNMGQQRKAQAAGMAPGIAAGEFLGYAPALATAEFGSSAPMDNAARYAAGLGGLLSPYGTQTSKQSGGLLGSLLGAGLSGFASGGFGSLFGGGGGGLGGLSTNGGLSGGFLNTRGRG